jgi:replicative DNA helicase
MTDPDDALRFIAAKQAEKDARRRDASGVEFAGRPGQQRPDGRLLTRHGVAGHGADAQSARPASQPTEGFNVPEYEPPIPLTGSVPVPPFPVDALPVSVAAMVRAVAEATQTDVAMAATCAISTLSACAGGHAEIEIRPGWREPLNTFTATIAEPGERKSAVQQAMTRVLQAVEQGLTETTMPARLEAQARKQIAERKAEKARNDAANSKKDKDNKRDHRAELEAENAAIEAARAVAEIDVPPVPRLVADDATPEATASLLAEQKGRVAIISSEGGVFDIIAGRYGGSVNMDVFLKGHAGDPIRIDRKGRPPEYIPRPALTLGLMIQPEVLRSIAAHRAFRGRGLLARFLYARPVSKVGHRRIAATPVPEWVTNAYNDDIATLAAGLAQWAGDPAILVLTPEADEAMRKIEARIEPQLASDGELAALKDWGAKLAGAIARIAGVIHLTDHGPGAGPTTPVTAETIDRASRIGDYFKAAAINVFAEMGTDQDTADAIYLLERIEHLGVDALSERDLLRAAKRFKTRVELLPALTQLVEHGYLIPLPPDQPTGGRPASPRYGVTVTKGTQATEGRR